MTPLEFVQTWGAVIAAVGAFLASSGAFFKMGKVEGLATSWFEAIRRLNDRDDNQSDAIKEHSVALIRLDLDQKRTRDQIETLTDEIKEQHADLSLRITGVSNQIAHLEPGDGHR